MYDIVPESGYTERCEANVSSVDNDIIRKYFEKNGTVVTFRKENETFGKLIRSEYYGEEQGIEVPVAIMTAFKELFKRFQKYEYSAHTCSFSNYAVHIRHVVIDYLNNQVKEKNRKVINDCKKEIVAYLKDGISTDKIVSLVSKSKNVDIELVCEAEKEVLDLLSKKCLVAVDSIMSWKRVEVNIQ